ncbi:MAG: hypothetical protein K0S47_4366 [Herbinix sp.]|jgi:hypothetical protein|nr:hypothetical protein [Herbinix sp.]
MSTTTFEKKNHQLSSIRTTIGSGRNQVSFTMYPGSSRGGMTFRSGAMTTRINNKGETIAMGLKTGKHMTYFRKNGKTSSNIPSF